MLNRVGLNKDSPIDLTFLPLFSMVGKFVLWIGGVAAILHVYGFDLTGILISAGIVTLGITMGAQSVLSQLFNGISLLLTRPFNEGDCLQIAGETYVVKHVKLMYTEFLSEEKDRIITIPNNTVASATVTNISKYDKAFRLFIYFQIPYGQEVEKVEEVLLQMAEENKYVMHNYNKYKKPILKLIEFQDSGILMRLDVTVVDIAKWRVIESDMKKELYVKLSEAGIEMPFNRLEVTIMNSEVEKSTA
jgi:small-conductance mechanosensitive channel